MLTRKRWPRYYNSCETQARDRIQSGRQSRAAPWGLYEGIQDGNQGPVSPVPVSPQGPAPLPHQNHFIDAYASQLAGIGSDHASFCESPCWVSTHSRSSAILSSIAPTRRKKSSISASERTIIWPISTERSPVRKINPMNLSLSSDGREYRASTKGWSVHHATSGTSVKGSRGYLTLTTAIRRRCSRISCIRIAWTASLVTRSSSTPASGSPSTINIAWRVIWRSEERRVGKECRS